MSMAAKENLLQQEFGSLSQESLYEHLMEWGKRLPPYPADLKIESCRVVGCQSIMYLHTILEGTVLKATASSDALISSGLAALLLYLYNGEPPETVLKHPPKILQEIGIIGSLTMGRASGLASLYTKLQKEAISLLSKVGK